MAEAEARDHVRTAMRAWMARVRVRGRTENAFVPWLPF